MKQRRLVWFAVITVMVVGVSAYFITRNTTQDVRADSSPTPGYSGADHPADDARFQFAEPTTTVGPTTIPGGAPPLPETTTSAIPSTTDGGNSLPPSSPPAGADPTAPRPVAAPPTQPPIVRLPSIFDPGPSTTPTCSAYYLVMQAGRDTQNRFIDNPKTSIAAVRNVMLQRFDQALSVLDSAPTTPGPDLAVQQTLRSRIGEMRAIASSVKTVAQGAAVYYPLQLPRGPAETVGWPEILDHLTRNCPEVYRTSGDTVPHP